MGNKREINERKRNNARLYPIYKMLSWDLLCFYSIEFLFYTKTKGVTASEVLIINAFYIIFKLLMQIPAVAIADILGKRKGIIIGNILIIVYLVTLIISPGMLGIIIADLFCALGYAIKTIAETNLLYDSVATRGGEGLYSKLDTKGGSWYYWIDGIACLSAGYLFVINNYLPMFICLGFVIISTVLSFSFKDIYPTNKDKRKNMGQVLKDYSLDLKESFKFITKSRRMKSYIIFGAIFYGIIKIIDIYKSDLLISKGIPEEQFSMIFATLSLLGGVAVTLSRKIHKKFRSRTLSFISLSYVGACILIGIVTNVCTNSVSVPIILIMYAVLRMCTSIWYILKDKYLKNFSTEKIRNKIMFTYELIVGIVASTMSVIGSLVLKKFGVDLSFLLVSLGALIAIVLTLDYMRTRFGLKPEEYRKEDIEMKEVIKQ
ncbi:MAG: MFS transporter [Clostridia bacterium]